MKKTKNVAVLMFILMWIGMVNENLIFAQQHEKDNIEKLFFNDKISIEKTIKDYYDLAYDIYLSLELKDMSLVLNMESIQNQNFMIAMEENIYGYKDWLKKLEMANVSEEEMERYPLYFEFEQPEIDGDRAIIKVNIKGEDLEAYPAFVVLGENEFHLDKIEGKWLINEHYYDDWYLFEGSRTEKKDLFNEKEFQKILDKTTGTDVEEMIRNFKLNEELNNLNEKFSNKEMKTNNDFSVAPFYIPHEDIGYSSNRAVEYAKEFSKSSNPVNSFFYEVPEDCTNFVSQCVSYGFGDTSLYEVKTSYRRVKGVWSGGEGGGFPAWESVNYHWNYMTRDKEDRERGPRVKIASSINQLRVGGVMQVMYGGEYAHSVICISTNPYKFAQHSGVGIRTYRDYPKDGQRFYNPVYFREY